MYNTNKLLGEYITGLFEGDGYIWIPSLVTQSKKKHNPRFTITFHKNNEKLALFIKKKLGNFGFIRQKIKENAVVLIISEINGLLVILQLFHNNIKTPKIRQINELICWLNINKGFNLKLEKLSNKNLINSAWLCGFIEAEGCFFIRVSINKTLSRVSFRLSIDQRLNDPKTNDNYYFIMEEIGNLFNTKVLKITRKKNNYSYWSLSITNLVELKKVINYFNTFLLLGIKRLDFCDWEKGFYLYINREQITPNLLNDLLFLKNNMNRQRKNFTYSLL